MTGQALPEVPRRARCLIVDDEAPAREELRFLLRDFDDVMVVGEAGDVEEAKLLLGSLDYDVVLLDIRMPGASGLDLAAWLRDRATPPAVVFTTAYPDHAVDAFDLAAADYLVKPIEPDRLRRALDRALDRPAEDDEDVAGAGTGAEPAPAAAEELLQRIPVQLGERTVLVDAAEVRYASAARGYSYLKLRRDRVLVTMSLAELERRLPGHFFRAHRSFLVNLRYVRELVPDFRGALVLVMDDQDGSRVEVSRRQARGLRRRLGL